MEQGFKTEACIIHTQTEIEMISRSGITDDSQFHMVWIYSADIAMNLSCL